MRVWFTTLSLLLKRFAGACVLAVGAILVTSVAAAEAYPAKPVRMIIPYVAGGNADIQARYIAERLERRAREAVRSSTTVAVRTA